jgi:hypothetical protein
MQVQKQIKKKRKKLNRLGRGGGTPWDNCSRIICHKTFSLLHNQSWQSSLHLPVSGKRIFLVKMRNNLIDVCSVDEFSKLRTVC